MTIRRGYSVREDLKKPFEEVGKQYGISKFISACLIMFKEKDSYFMRLLEKNLIGLLKK